ncbi:hypothetical protein FIA58_005890 [Flavobacterium jejuense]|uniref:Uncharacterized protein n=1 Tax=Flavobacterium jejuense TaxID=1544455 RepID=A0ABX0INN3_9FLAO|nr:hypothetical protein [Flavobacterium jejuense]NHN25206.1 hypothetical protein [Flavobacterium jejuense]
MTRIRTVGGKMIETTGGDYNIYTKESIVYSATTTIAETGVEKGVLRSLLKKSNLKN